MTIEWTGPDKEKSAALERMVALQGILIEQLSGFVETAMRRIHALQEILEERGTLTRAAVEARSQAMDLESTAELELNPKYEEFRRQRAAIRRMQEEDESPQT